jgi:hypothetical protein
MKIIIFIIVAGGLALMLWVAYSNQKRRQSKLRRSPRDQAASIPNHTQADSLNAEPRRRAQLGERSLGSVIN